MGKASIERKLARLGALGVLGWIAGGAASACSGGGEFRSSPPTSEDPDASLDSGSGGRPGAGGASAGGGGTASGGDAAGGEGGGPSAGGSGATTSVDGGSGGSGPPPDCTRDEDCAPLTCNGIPRCIDGACAAGDPCAPSTSPNCANECVRTATGASCVAMGKDEDKDGHRDALCAEAPGDDCNDKNDTVYAGAAEECDGLDNDCDQKLDVFDGLSISAGGAEVIGDIAKTARLALAKQTTGHALLTMEMQDFYAGLGNPTDVRVFDDAGALSRATPITGSLNMIDPAMAAVGNELVLFGYLNTGTENVLTMTRKVNVSGALQPPLPFNRMEPGAQVWGRAIASRPNGSFVLVWDELPGSSASPSGIVYASRTTAGSDGPHYLYQIPAGGSRAYRPSVAIQGTTLAFGVAWMERLAGSEMTARIHLTRHSAEGPDADGVLDTFAFPSVALQYAGEAIRPQVTFDGAAFTVAWRAPGNTLRVARVKTDGEPLCGPTPIEGIGTWGGGASMANALHGVLLAATATNGDVVLLRVADVAGVAACDIQRAAVLNSPKKRVASGVAFEQNQLNVSVGDPVIAVGSNNRVLVAWVERDRTAAEAQDVGVAPQSPPEPNHVVLRTLGANLCD